MIAERLWQHLTQLGRFYRTSDNRYFFFSKNEKRLYDLDQEEFQHLVTTTSGLSPTEDYYTFSFQTTRANVARNSPLAEVRTFAHFNPESGRLVVSDAGSGVWVLDNGGSWTSGDNGEFDTIFYSDSHALPWKPDFSANGAALEWFLDRFNFAGNDEEVACQRQLLAVWLVSLFFRSELETRPIPGFFGPKGSGKTSTCKSIGRLFQGSRFQVSGIRRDKEDAFIASVTNRTFHVIDNADARIPWLEDSLARYATGEMFPMRRLYTTNEEVDYWPKAVILLTSRDPHFRRPDVAERLLPFNLNRIAAFQGETAFLKELYVKRSQILGDLLKKAQIAAEAMTAIPSAPTLPCRMADFAAFGWRIYQHHGKAQDWLKVLDYLEKAQADFAAEDDIIVGTIEKVIESGIPDEITTGDLFEKCRVLAAKDDLPFPRTPQAFGRQFFERAGIIEAELGVKIRTRKVGKNKTAVTFQRSAEKEQ